MSVPCRYVPRLFTVDTTGMRDETRRPMATRSDRHGQPWVDANVHGLSRISEVVCGSTRG